MAIIIQKHSERKQNSAFIFHQKNLKPKMYKRNSIKGNLDGPKKFATDFQKEVTLVRKNFSKRTIP